MPRVLDGRAMIASSMSEPRRAGAGFQAAAGAVGAVMHNASMRRVLLAYIGFSVAEWATWIAVLVYAFDRGGATETGIVALVQLAPSAVVAPLAAAAGDRVRRDRALIGAYIVQAVAMAAAAAALLTDASSLVVYAAAAVVTTTITLTRPIQAAILPSLARTPAELTAANVAAGAVETSAILVGPMLVGVGLVAVGAGAVFAVSAGVMLAGAGLVAGIRPIAAHREPGTRAASGGDVAREALAGFITLAREPRPRIVILLLGSAAVLWGVLDVFIVVLALDALRMGEAGVGYLNGALGAGASSVQR
jgi:MFS family permease